MIPTLHNGSRQILQTPGEMCAYLIRFMFVNPGRTSDYYEDMLISFRELVAKYESDMDALSMSIQSQLQQAVSRCMPNEDIVVSVSATKTGEVNYKISITVQNEQGEPIMNGTNVSVENDIIQIS